MLGVILENMDSQIKFRVLNLNNITNFEIIVELENVENGIPTEGVLKSLNLNLFWEVQNRIIESIIEKRFEYEDVIQSHINKNEPSIGNEEIIIQREEKNIRLYKIKPIGNTQKPEIGEDLVFHTTTFRSKIQIKEIYESYFRLEDENGYVNGGYGYLLFHMNWGWSGGYNMFCGLNNFSAAGNTFNYKRKMIYGIRK